jgi:hypothetical protein
MPSGQLWRIGLELAGTDGSLRGGRADRKVNLMEMNGMWRILPAMVVSSSVLE